MEHNLIKKNYKIYKSDNDLQEIRDYISKYIYLSFDTETTGLNVREDTVIGLSFSGKHGDGFYVARFSWDVNKQELVRHMSDYNFISILKQLSNKELLMWNGSYDCRIVKNDLGIDLLDSFICDGMLLKHTVHEEGNFILKKVAIDIQNEIGYDAEEVANQEQVELKESVKANGGETKKTNYEMYKADLDILGKYAAADADMTLRICDYYYTILEKQGLNEFFFDSEVMPLYKEVTIKMEEMGIVLDMDLLYNTRDDIIEDIQAIESEVVDKLLSMDQVKKWLTNYLNSKYPINTKGSFGQQVCEHFNLDIAKTISGKYSLTQKSIKSSGESNKAIEFLLGNCALGTKEVYDIQYKLHIKKEGKVLNISSKKQMGDIVFNFMKIKPLSKTAKGSPQFDDNMIQHLEELGHDWAKTLGNYNKLVKIKGTYIDRFIDAQENGIFYPSFYQHRTISGRYGSDLQQLPRPKEQGQLDDVVLKYNNIIRKFFIAGDNRIFVDNDYESLEPHVFAHVSNDEGLRDIFRKGHDFYSTIAIKTEKLDGVSADKKAENYLGKVNKQLRQKAKAYSLGVPYGMKGYALGMTLGVSQEEAEGLIEGYLSGFPNLREWMKVSEDQAKYNGYVSSEVGRIRHLDKVKDIHKKHGRKILDYKYRAKLNKKLGKDVVLNMYRDYKNGLNNAKNFQIQSLSASIVNMAAIEINRELTKRGINGWVALQIHDQLVINVPVDKAEECKELVQNIMENNYKLSLALKAPAELGHNLYEAH